ncbi:hypothetical protein BKA70DRAFT_1477020 [Coprinopsis sp. MPI-PUGE-AT-0042]|nr:hypothetical protein BKA70DRAFT_1477020 [Coprinopsis sp. MPI-PUGE-AT-0042]
MSATTAPATGSKAMAANALRSAGLLDKDTQMRDATDKPGGRKGSSKIRSHRNRPIDAFKDQGPSRLSSRIATSTSHAGPSDPLAIRGAARPTAAGRLRRGAVSAGSAASNLVGGPRVTVSRPKGVESWRELVRKRWNAETQFLNLENLLDDELVKKYNLSPPGTGGGGIREAGVIFKLAGELKPPPKTLSLANNGMNGEHLQYLAKYLPNIVNLSLQGNNIRTVKDLDTISARRNQLNQLRELVLIGNPVREQNPEQYKSELTRKFASLQVLDQEPIAQIGFDVPKPVAAPAAVKKPSATTFPVQMQSNFITGVDGSIVSNFLVRYYNLFDNQREALVHAYDPAATFSYSVNTAIPARARLQGFQYSKDMPNQRNLTWAPWLTADNGGSRNLTRLSSGLSKALESLHIGGPKAVSVIQTLPGTRHDISGPPEKFCLDAFPVPIGQGMGLLVTVHGQFTEVGIEGVRSFDRSFVLAPALEGSAARANGWDVMVLSDQWTVRLYSSHEAWKPGPLLVQAPFTKKPRNPPPAATTTTTTTQPQKPNQLLFESLPSDQQSKLNLIPEPQRTLVLEIMARTNLNVQFALDCLQENEWDIDRAMANFNQVKSTLGRDAYV